MRDFTSLLRSWLSMLWRNKIIKYASIFLLKCKITKRHRNGFVPIPVSFFYVNYILNYAFFFFLSTSKILQRSAMTYNVIVR